MIVYVTPVHVSHRILIKALYFQYIKMHQCTTCGKAYSSRGNLRRHQETHGEKKACNCGATFNCNEQLTRHKQAVHAGGFKCTKCIILFKSRSALVCHNRNLHHTTERVLKVCKFNNIRQSLVKPSYTCS